MDYIEGNLVGLGDGDIRIAGATAVVMDDMPRRDDGEVDTSPVATGIRLQLLRYQDEQISSLQATLRMLLEHHRAHMQRVERHFVDPTIDRRVMENRAQALRDRQLRLQSVAIGTHEGDNEDQPPNYTCSVIPIRRQQRAQAAECLDTHILTKYHHNLYPRHACIVRAEHIIYSYMSKKEISK